MAQHDYVISNGTGAAVRSDLNNALLAIVSQNSGATEPTTTYAYQWWADTTTGLLKIRNSANNAWITLRELDGTLTVEDGTVSAPGLAFRDDLNTGIWRPGTDQFAISTNGIERVEWGTSEVVFNDGGTNYDFRIEGDNNANLLFVDASADAVGIGTSAPGAKLTIQQAANTVLEGLLLVASSGSVNGGWYHNGSALVGREGGFDTINLAAGKVGIGTQSPGRLLTLDGGASSVYLQLTNTAAGSSAPNGFEIFCDGTNAGLLNRENGYLAFDTNSLERARIDSSGRLLVGTSTASLSQQIESASTGGNNLGIIRYNNGTGGSEFVLAHSRSNSVGTNTVLSSGDRISDILFRGADGTNYIDAASISAFVDATPGANDMPGRLVFSTTADGASSPTERMRITNSGNLQVGTTSGTARLNLLAGAQVAATITNTNTDDLIAVKGNSGGSSGSGVYVMPMRFGDDTLRGSIYWNGSTVAYNTTSDYRLKENINTYTDALDKLANLKPVTYTFTDNPNVVLEGFIAHEVQDVVPNAVSGVKDEVDPKGNPLYQGLDTAKLVPLLTAALQEAVAKIESLEARLTAAGI